MRTLLERVLKLHLLPGKPSPGFMERELHDNTFGYWRDVWTSTFKNMGALETLNPDHFLRQDCIAVLAQQSKVAAIHLYTFFDLAFRAHREHSYMTHHCTPAVLKALDEARARRVMSLEYLSVHPEWRASKVGVSLSSIMITNGVRLAFDLGADAVLGVARVDRGIDKMATDLGARVLDVKPKLYNEIFAVVGFFPGETKPNPKDEERRLAEIFWNGRLDSTDLNGNEAVRKAA